MQHGPRQLQNISAGNPDGLKTGGPANSYQLLGQSFSGQMYRALQMYSAFLRPLASSFILRIGRRGFHSPSVPDREGIAFLLDLARGRVRTLVAQLGNESGRLQPAHGRELSSIDDNGIVWLARGDEGNQAVVTALSLPANAAGTINGKTHTETIRPPSDTG